MQLREGEQSEGPLHPDLLRLPHQSHHQVRQPHAGRRGQQGGGGELAQCYNDRIHFFRLRRSPSISRSPRWWGLCPGRGGTCTSRWAARTAARCRGTWSGTARSSPPPRSSSASAETRCSPGRMTPGPALMSSKWSRDESHIIDAKHQSKKFSTMHNVECFYKFPFTIYIATIKQA